MPRPRLRKNTSLPPYLYAESSGGFRFILTNGKRVRLNQPRAEAIAIANEYNRKMRTLDRTTLEKLVGLSDTSDLADTLGKSVPSLVEQIRLIEKPGRAKLDALRSDALRAEEFFQHILPSDVTLNHVNEYMEKYHRAASNNVYNRKLAWLAKLFEYAADQGLMEHNPAKLKKRKPKDQKRRVRLTADDYQLIYSEAKPFLRTAMELSFQTTHARLEISRIKYNLDEPRKGECGCYWYKQPVDGIWGKLFIHRQKTHEHESSWVAIPIGDELYRIIEESKADGIDSPYVVHREAGTSSNKQSEEVCHPTQVTADYISRAFSEIRDELGLYADLPPRERPGFHEIRALSAKLFKDSGIKPQKRMAHKDEQSTRIYTDNHAKWTEVEHAQLESLVRS